MLLAHAELNGMHMARSYCSCGRFGTVTLRAFDSTKPCSCNFVNSDCRWCFRAANSSRRECVESSQRIDACSPDVYGCILRHGGCVVSNGTHHTTQSCLIAYLQCELKGCQLRVLWVSTGQLPVTVHAVLQRNKRLGLQLCKTRAPSRNKDNTHVHYVCRIL